jgi:hypothetical protein
MDVSIVPIIFNGINIDLGFGEIYLNNIHLPHSVIYILPFRSVDNSKAGKMVIGKRILTVNPRNGVMVIRDHWDAGPQ